MNGGRLVNKLSALLLYITAKCLHVKNTGLFPCVSWHYSGRRPSYMILSSPYTCAQFRIVLVHFLVVSKVDRYEYCIQQFAAYEGVKGGEFYTPASIVKTIVAILKPFKNCRVYDPCCGSGGMFVQSAKFIQAHSGKRGEIAVYGQESNADTWKIAKMNIAIRGIDADFGPYQADTFFNDLHKTLKADFIMANPPFNLSNWGQDKLKDDVRWKYGTPPAGNANYAWIQHMIHHLAPNGKIGLVLARYV